LREVLDIRYHSISAKGNANRERVINKNEDVQERFRRNTGHDYTGLRDVHTIPAVMHGLKEK